MKEKYIFTSKMLYAAYISYFPSETHIFGQVNQCVRMFLHSGAIFLFSFHDYRFVKPGKTLKSSPENDEDYKQLYSWTEISTNKNYYIISLKKNLIVI